MKEFAQACSALLIVGCLVLLAICMTGCTKGQFNLQSAQTTSRAFLNGCENGTIQVQVEQTGDDHKLTMTCKAYK